MFFVFGGRSRGDMHMGYKLSPMALAGLVRNALGLCDLFFFVWWHRTGEAKIWSSSWSLANILGLLVAGPPVGSRSVYFCVCVVTDRDRDGLCVSGFAQGRRPKQVPTRADVLKPCVVANHSSKHSFTSKTGLRKHMFL